jgi:hypothetical protein
MVITNTLQLELKLGRIWLKDNRGHGTDYEREEYRDSLLVSADDNGFISEQRAPNWFRETKLGFMGAHGHPQFPVRISTLDYFGNVDSSSNVLDRCSVTLNRNLNWQEYVSLGKRKSITADVSYSLS